MIKIYVLSNDVKFINVLFEYIYRSERLKIVGCSDDILKLALSIHSINKPDIVFFDKQIDEQCVISLYSLLQQAAFKIVFINQSKSSSNIFLKKYNLDYLKKRFSYEDFLKKIDVLFGKSDDLKPTSIMNFHNEDHFFIKCEKGKIIRIDIPDILYIEANQNYITINQTREKCTANFTLNGIEQVLPTHIFIRVHRSFIVNINKIRSIESNRLIVDKNVVIPIGQSYKDKVLNTFNPKILVLNKIVSLFFLVISILD